MPRERTLIPRFLRALAAALLLATCAAAQAADGAGARDDAAYTARIREYTTEKYFSTELVDHLPASAGVPAPDKLLGGCKAMYWLSGSIHSPEAGSPEMLMELAYRLAVDESPLVRGIRRDTIVLITPVLEVDGHDRMVDVYNYHRANLGKNSPNLF